MNRLRNFGIRISILSSFLCLVLLTWYLPGTLMQIQKESMARMEGTIPLPARSESESSEKRALPAKEIHDILYAWDSEDLVYVEPSGDQLTMEEVINRAQATIRDFAQAEVLPPELKTMQYSSMSFAMRMPSAVSERAIPPEYGQWQVSLVSDQCKITLSINAYTGQVWQMNTAILDGSGVLGGMDLKKIVAGYIEYLDADCAFSPVSDGDGERVLYTSEEGITVFAYFAQTDKDTGANQFSLTLQLDEPRAVPDAAEPSLRQSPDTGGQRVRTP